MPRLLRLAAVGTLAGGFSGLFGVGGGVVMVPLMVLWLGYSEREAAGTSLMAIVVIAAVTASAQGAYGNVDVPRGLLIGIPAVGGVLAGAALQQHVPARWISLVFSAVLAGAAISLLVP